jgi:prephenate dehydrogenase
LIDEFSLDYRVAAEVDLQICCLPVDRIPEAVRQAAACMQPGAVVTDAGSVKGSICESIGSEPAPGIFFVGSHPLAGSEKQGFAHADPDLFAGRTCVVTPAMGTDGSAIACVGEFWQRLGSSVLMLSPVEHDRVLARTSHMPHAVAAAVAAALCPADIPLAATGFRDTTRIAAGDPALWTSILSANRVAVASELQSHIDRCQQFVSALQAGQVELVEHLLAEGKRCRDAVGKSSV